MGDLASATAADIQATGRARLAELAVEAAEKWRQQQAEHIEQALAWLDERLMDDLQAELDAVREAAAELLGLTLSVPGPGQRLAPDLRFFYLVADQAGQTELLAGATMPHRLLRFDQRPSPSATARRAWSLGGGVGQHRWPHDGLCRPTVIPVSVTIGGYGPFDGTVDDSTGDFTITCPTATVPVGRPYTISLSYAGDGSVYLNAAANDTSTALRVVSVGPGVFTNPTSITNFTVVDMTNVTVRGTNGQSGDAYYLLQSTDISLPLPPVEHGGDGRVERGRALHDHLHQRGDRRSAAVLHLKQHQL